MSRIAFHSHVAYNKYVDPSDSKSEEFFTTVSSFIRKQRCSDGMMQRIKQGIYPWKPPVGYACEHFKKRGEKKTAADPPDEVIFPIIQSVLKEFAAGMHSQSELAHLLDARGLKRARGIKTTPQLVDRLIGKYLKFYAGIIVNPWNGDEVDGLHTPKNRCSTYGKKGGNHLSLRQRSMRIS